ncbi:MAG: polysaccharide deacetylase family protein [Burkholderiales bacterium]|nr:polysaccharide deacetylase family protein [Burkholderiales bacterium]
MSRATTATIDADAASPPTPLRGRSPLRAYTFAAARALGLFALCRLLYRKRQCILAYHAFAYEDEQRFRPQLYMHPQRFAARLDLLTRKGYRVISLDEATRRLRDGRCALRDVVITIDDGFSSVHRFAAPALRARGMPATLYLTTCYVGKPQPVFGLALEYVLWKSGLAQARLNLAPFGVDVDGVIPLRDAAGREAVDRIVALAERTLDASGRYALLEHIARCVGVSLDAVNGDRRFSLVSVEMARELRSQAIALELHTHRHRFPELPDQLAREIDDNRAALRSIGVADARHLCYPSGEWRESAFSQLEAKGVVTSTTCMPGLNDRRVPLLALRRFLDADDIPDVEFEAEISGFKQLLRDCRAALAGG